MWRYKAWHEVLDLAAWTGQVSHLACLHTQQFWCLDVLGIFRFPHIAVVFDGVETKWVPNAYFYRHCLCFLATNSFCPHMARKGKTDTYCYGFEDDGPHANTVLGAVWMTHQAMPSCAWWALFCFLRLPQSCGVRFMEDIIFDMERSEVGIAPANCCMPRIFKSSLRKYA